MSTYKESSKPKNPVNFGKAVRILDLLLRGELPKNIAVDEDISQRSVYDVKSMFPLFFPRGSRKP